MRTSCSRNADQSAPTSLASSVPFRVALRWELGRGVGAEQSSCVVSPTEAAVTLGGILSPVADSTDSRSSRSTELAHEGAEPTLARFAGKWVALEGQKVIEHGTDPDEVVRRARGRGIAVPCVFYVEPAGPDIVKMGL